MVGGCAQRKEVDIKFSFPPGLRAFGKKNDYTLAGLHIFGSRFLVTVFRCVNKYTFIKTEKERMGEWKRERIQITHNTPGRSAVRGRKRIYTYDAYVFRVRISGTCINNNNNNSPRTVSGLSCIIWKRTRDLPSINMDLQYPRRLRRSCDPRVEFDRTNENGFVERTTALRNEMDFFFFKKKDKKLFIYSSARSKSTLISSVVASIRT